jgi:potassium-transporting ATPase KdpC subunit
MKNHLLPSALLTAGCIVLFSAIYPLVIWGIAQLTPHRGMGEISLYKDKTNYGYSNVGQLFNQDKYFWSRPSAMSYNAAGSGGSNKGPSNQEYLGQVEARIDSFLVHNPGVTRNQIPTELVTASGSGLDPDISLAGAIIQIKRIARYRQLDEKAIEHIILQHVERPMWEIPGPSHINVLKLNIDLNELSKSR